MKIKLSAWLRIVSLRDCGDVEIGGYGLVDKEDPSTIIDFLMPKQKCTSAYNEFDDADVVRLTDEQVAKDIAPNRFLRVWIHTHPGSMNTPSGKDESTFKELYDSSDWAVMIIIAKDNSSYCRVKHTTGVKTEVVVPLVVDYTDIPAFVYDPVALKAEYTAKVSEDTYVLATGYAYGRQNWNWEDAEYGKHAHTAGNRVWEQCSVCRKWKSIVKCRICGQPVCSDCSDLGICEHCILVEDAKALESIGIPERKACGEGVCKVCGKPAFVFQCPVCKEMYCDNCESDTHYSCKVCKPSEIIIMEY